MAHRPLVASQYSGSGTAQVASSSGVLHSVTVTSPGTIDLFDGGTSGRKVASLGSATGRFVFNEPFGRGLALSVSGSAAFSIEVRERRA